MAKLRGPAVRPAALHFVGHDEAHAEASRHIDQPGGCRGHRRFAEVVRSRVQEQVEHGRDVLLAHRVHGDERQLQIAAAGTDHRPQVLAEPLHAARQPVDVALDAQEAHVLEIHLRSPTWRAAGGRPAVGAGG
jgi:hypothetical protein